MAVTSDTLFHYTSSLSSLINILSEKFKITYCLEQYYLNGIRSVSYYPMICFCDIPLSQAKEHIKSYGPYGIGLTKAWGIRNNLNPVTYIDEQSHLAIDIQQTIEHFKTVVANISNHTKNANSRTSKLLGELSTFAAAFRVDPASTDALKRKLTEFKDRLDDDNSSRTDLLAVIQSFGSAINTHTTLFRYIKNYQGDLIRKDKTIPDYRFYNEREWRYVPAIGDPRIKWQLSETDYNTYRGKGKKKPFIPGITLPFRSADVKYLIVSSNRDIPKLIAAIRKSNELISNAADADVLATKILTVDQLNDDF